MGKLRAAAKAETELQGIEVHFLKNKDAVIFVMVDSETREAIKGEAETCNRALACFDLCYEQAEYMAVMPSFIDAAEFADKYRAMGFKVNMITAPQGNERRQLKAMHDFCIRAADCCRGRS